MWLGWISSPCALARVLWNDPEWQEIRAARVVIPLMGKGVSPQDNTSDRTLYLRFSIEPLSDGVSDAANRYEAGWRFEERGQPRLGLGNAWFAWGYSAFHAVHRPKPLQAPGEVDFRSARPEEPGRQDFEYPRVGNRRTVVARIRFIPGTLDQITVWLDPDLTSGLREEQLPEALTTRFEADASFDTCVLIHRGGGAGWRMGDLAVASSFDDLLTPPFWRQPLFLGPAVLLIAGVMGSTGWRQATKNRRALRQRSQELETARALERERTRIARDLQDSLGATLGEISLLSSLAETHATPDQIEGLTRIQRRAREATEALRNIVWAIDPEADTVAHFIDHASGFGNDLLLAAGLKSQISRPPAGVLAASAVMSATHRHHASLAFREAVHNAVRHSKAQMVNLGFELDTGRLTVWVVDDGCGTCPQPGEPRPETDAAGAGGHGLRNLQARLDAIGGSVSIDSHPDHGTRVRMEVPLGL